MSAETTQADVATTESYQSLADELKQAQQEQDAAKAEQANAAKSATDAGDRLKRAADAIKSLMAKQAVFEAVVKEYKAQADAWPAMSESLTAASKAADSIAEAGMDDATKQKIPKLVNASADKVDSAAKDVRTTETALKKANDESADANARVDKANARLEATKQAPKQLAADLKVLAALQAEIATLRDKGQFTALHLCVLELNKRQSAVSVDTDKLATDLLAAMREVDAAAANAADKKRQVDELTQTLAARKKALDELNKNPRASLLALLESKPA